MNIEIYSEKSNIEQLNTVPVKVEMWTDGKNNWELLDCTINTIIHPRVLWDVT